MTRHQVKTYAESIILILLVIQLFRIYSVHAVTNNGFDLSKSLVPVSEIFSGGPQKDGIPALTDPKFISAAKADWLNEDDRILGVYLNGIAKAYPLNIMNWHEIVNDSFGDHHVLVTYCPLCFSGMAFNPVINGERHLFGVSGLLYNSDVLIYDRKTESLWSQIMSRAITGKYFGRELEAIPLENTTWREWRRKHPGTVVLSRLTGYVRNYGKDPYEEYRQSPETMFPVRFRAVGYHPKELVMGVIIDDQPKAYPVSELSRTNGFFSDNIAGQNIYISFNEKELTSRILDSTCKPLPATKLFWFAWYTFYPDTEVFKANTINSQTTEDHCES